MTGKLFLCHLLIQNTSTLTSPPSSENPGETTGDKKFLFRSRSIGDLGLCVNDHQWPEESRQGGVSCPEGR
jgi:hypothetical protein